MELGWAVTGMVVVTWCDRVGRLGVVRGEGEEVRVGPGEGVRGGEGEEERERKEEEDLGLSMVSPRGV